MKLFKSLFRRKRTVTMPADGWPVFVAGTDVNAASLKLTISSITNASRSRIDVTTLTQRHAALPGAEPADLEVPTALRRFLVPWLCQYQGWAVFLDSNIVVMQDLGEMFSYADQQYPLMRSCGSEPSTWNSVILFNCAHPANRSLTPQSLNQFSTFEDDAFVPWLQTHEIGELPRAWNLSVGYDLPVEAPSLLSFPIGYDDSDSMTESMPTELRQAVGNSFPSKQCGPAELEVMPEHEAFRLSELLPNDAAEVARLEKLREQGAHALVAGATDEAHRSFAAALHLAPRSALSHADIACLRETQGRIVDAVQNYNRALTLNAVHLPSLMGLAKLYDTLGRWGDSLALLRRAASAHPNQHAILPYLGAAEHQSGNISEARTTFSKALEFTLNQPSLLSLLGAADFSAGDLRAAEPRLRAAVQMQPNNAENVLRLGSYLLMTGEFGAGWDAAESRLHIPRQQIPWYYPRWQSQSLEGASILLQTEQGVGDEVLFASCIDDLLKHYQPRRCVINCDPRLVPLFARTFATTECVTFPKTVSSKTVTESLGFIDYQVAIGSLPTLFRREVAAFPKHKGFLSADQKTLSAYEQWLSTFGDKPKIGVSWRGGGTPLSQKLRSLALPLWQPIFSHADAQFFTIQYGITQHETETWSDDNRHLTDIDAKEDLDHLAAFMCALDLVITVDNATANLAGALGVETWCILPPMPNWRWLLKRDDSIWYPSIRLFRQSREDDAAATLIKVADALKNRYHQKPLA